MRCSTFGEIGLKSTLMDGQLTLNTAVFDGKYKDIQVSTFTSYDSNGDGVPDAFFGNFLNAGNASMKGAEVEFDSAPHSVSWFAVNGYVSYSISNRTASSTPTTTASST